MNNYIGYHGTSSEYVESITNKESLDPEPNKLPGDLGHGLYMFIDRPEFSVNDPKKNAALYVKKYKNNYAEKKVLEITSEISSDAVLDMNLPQQQEIFMLFKEENSEKIEAVFRRLVKNGSKKRGNVDGLILEIMFKDMGIQIDAIIKDTYTPFDFPGYRLSSFYNGRELCLRNLDCIVSCEICMSI